MKINFKWEKNKYQEDSLYVDQIEFGTIKKSIFESKDGNIKRTEFCADFFYDSIYSETKYFNSKEKAKLFLEKLTYEFINKMIKAIKI